MLIYQDPYFVAVNKPNGLLVHKSSIASDAKEFALQIVRNLVGKHIYPVHRLDRKTSGVLLFALSSEVAKNLQTLMEGGKVTKRYLAIVRGYFPDEVNLQLELTNDAGKAQSAETLFRCLSHAEIQVPFGKHSTSRYSLIEAFPKTGRMHQIRRHLNHLRHPIIGDRPWGCNKQNKLFLERWSMNTMLLHAVSVELPHPVTHEKLLIQASFYPEFARMLNTLALPIK